MNIDTWIKALKHNFILFGPHLLSRTVLLHGRKLLAYSVLSILKSVLFPAEKVIFIFVAIKGEIHDSIFHSVPLKERKLKKLE